MTLDKRTREQMLAFCGEIHEDDGVDPRQFFKTEKHRNKRNYKFLQLCQQVTETLSLAMASEFDDERLHNLEVVSVERGADASQMVVNVRTDISCNFRETEEILELLSGVGGQLRCIVASAISRKRTPNLTFRIVGLGESTEVQP